MGLDWEAHDVLTDFREYQRASQDTDLVFHCTNGNVSAHQMIFAGISPFLTDLMQRFVIGQELFPLDLNISLPEIRREHVEMVVEMVYTGQVRITKRDYQPFREICQLLKLCVPIADYDNFFMNQCDNVDGSNSFDALDAQEQVSIPLKSPTAPRVFVCDECDAIFLLKIALKRHKMSQHDESGSEKTNSSPSPIVSEVSTETQLNTRPTRRRALNGSKNLVCLQNDESMVECPDCQSLFGLRQVRQHLAVHLKEELRALVMRSESVTGIFKCQESLCSYETTVSFYMSRHLGVIHDFITKFANEAQMKFLHEAQELIRKPRISSLKPCNLSPINKDRNLNQRRISQRILENEDGPENENNDIEPESESPGEDSAESETQPSNEPDELNPAMVSQLNQPSSLSLNGTMQKSTLIADLVIECPDCQSLIHPSRVKHHLMRHLKKELNVFLKRSESKRHLFECQFCSYKTISHGNMRHHVGVIHDEMSKVTNDAQKKFLHDAQNMMRKQKNKIRPNNLGTKSRIQENEDFPEVDEEHVEIECNNGLKDATNSVSTRRDGRALKCPDCRKLIHPRLAGRHLTSHMREKLNKYTSKSESGCGLLKCQLCSHGTDDIYSMHHHVGAKHQMMMKYVDEAQKKFIEDAQRMLLRRRRPKTLKKKRCKKLPQNIICPHCLQNYPPHWFRRHLASHQPK